MTEPLIQPTLFAEIEEVVAGFRKENESVRDALMECDWDVETEPADCIRRMKKEIDRLRSARNPTWHPDAGTWVLLEDGDPPLRVEEVHYNNGVAKLSDGSWAAFTHMVQVPEPLGAEDVVATEALSALFREYPGASDMEQTLFVRGFKAGRRRGDT